MIPGIAGVGGHIPASAGGGGGAITFVGGKSHTWDGAGTTTVISLTDLTGGLASSPSQNDFVVLNLVVANNGASLDLNPVTSGYTEHCDIYKDDDGLTLSFGGFTKFMGASPDSQVEIQSIGASERVGLVRILVFRGVNLTTPMDVAVVTNSGINDPDATTPAITPVTAGAMVVDMAASCTGNILNLTTHTNPGLFSPFLMSKQGKGLSSMGAKAWVSGAMGPYAHGGGSDNTACWAALNMALRPA